MDEILKDFLGNEIGIGDEVVFIRPNYRDYSRGKIDRSTKCYLFIKYEYNGHEYEIKQKPVQLIKVLK